MGLISGLCDNCENRKACYYLKEILKKPIPLIPNLCVEINHCPNYAGKAWMVRRRTKR